MRSLLRILIAVLLLGSAVQQGSLQAAIGFVVERLGGPVAAADAEARLDILALLRRVADAVATLPDPWHSLALMIGGIIGLTFAATIAGGLVRVTRRLSGWLRDAFV